MHLLRNTIRRKWRLSSATTDLKSSLPGVLIDFNGQDRIKSSFMLHSQHKNNASTTINKHTTISRSTNEKLFQDKVIVYAFNGTHSTKGNIFLKSLLSLGILTFGYIITFKRKVVHLATLSEPDLTSSTTKSALPNYHIIKRKDLPTFKRSDVEQHNSLERKVWVTYGIGVYDVTDFVENHPGGDKILLAAGSAIDPFWAIYQQHNTKEVLELIEGFRIGNLSVEERGDVEDMESIWANEPQRHSLLKPASKKPFNAEPPIAILADYFYTPNDLFYVRNHLPVPLIDERKHELEIEIETNKSGTKQQVKVLTMADIKALPKYSVTAAVMCGGNRRSEMTKVKGVKGKAYEAYS